MLSVSVFSGTPLQSSSDMKMNENVCPMKCCKNKASKSQKPKNADAKYLCRVLVCSQDTPTNTTTVSNINFAPVIIASEKVSLFEILFSTTPKEDDSNIAFINSVSPRQFLPKYIQHQRILI
ncbi:MAG: hypothetical protein ACR2J3_07000 [Aridibacter sp.]